MTNDIIAGAQRQAELEAAKASFFASGGRVTALPGAQFIPAPVRPKWIDPETVLVRKPRGLTRAQRNALKRMTEALS